MSNGKCMASQDGICRNQYAFGLECNGYSEKCKLRPAYNSIEKIYKNCAKKIRENYGIVGDKE